MPADDPLAEALLSDSAYERLRAREFGVLKRALHEKLAWQSYLLLALAALLPLAAFLPPGVRERYLADAALASPRWTVLGVVAVTIVWLTGLGHAGVAIRALRVGPSLSEVQAHELVSLENVCSLLGFGTAGVATLLTYAFFGLGFGGLDLIAAYAALGANPFEPVSYGVPIGTLAIVAMVGAVVLKFLSAFVYVESLRRDVPAVRGGY
ncbi:MAG: hypothetical protein ABEH47_03990 [Haloferacaceae archaeon]